MATKVTTLKNAEKTDNLLPRTELNAIFDSDGNYLDSNLKASDLNALKGGTVDELVRFTEDGAGTPIPTDADTLEGHDASYFATADALSSLSISSEIEEVSLGSSSISAGGTASFNKDYTPPTGKIVVGVLPVGTGHALALPRYFYYNYTEQKVYGSLSNASTSAITGTMTVWVILLSLNKAST